LKMVLQAHPYLWNLRVTQKMLYTQVFHREIVYFVFTIIDNIEYIDTRVHTQRTI
jgi:hypothetical protein